MKIKTSELTGRSLDYAVAVCEGGEGFWYDTIATYWIKINGKDRALSKGWAQSYTPSTDWSEAGPIIERHNIKFQRTFSGGVPNTGLDAFKSDVDFINGMLTCRQQTRRRSRRAPRAALTLTSTQ